MNNPDAFAERLARVVNAMARCAAAIHAMIATWLYEIERTLAPLADQVVELVHAVEDAKRIQRRHPHPPRVLVLRAQTVWRWRWSPLYGRR
jgi:hypothetical protein